MKNKTTNNYTIRLEDAVRQILEEEAERQNRTLGNMIMTILKQYIKEHDLKPNES